MDSRGTGRTLVGAMQRSSSGIVRASRSVFNAGKPKFEFMYTLAFERLENFVAPGDIVIEWQRNKASKCTRPVPTSTSSRTLVFSERERIVGPVQMVQKKGGFVEKEYKIAIRAGNQHGRILGYSFVDFAKYAGVPSGQQVAEIRLSNDAILVVIIFSKFLGKAKHKTKSSAGFSAIKENEPLLDKRDEFDPVEAAILELERREVTDDMSLDDLGIDIEDEDEFEPGPPITIRSGGASFTRKPKTLEDVSSPVSTTTDIPSRTNSYGKDSSKMGTLNFTQSDDNENIAKEEDDDDMEMRSMGRRVASDVCGAGAKTDWFKQRNAALHAENEDLKGRINELEQWKDRAENASTGELLKENDKLRAQVSEYRTRLEREPIMVDVLYELKQTKMALALMTMERDGTIAKISAE